MLSNSKILLDFFWALFFGLRRPFRTSAAFFRTSAAFSDFFPRSELNFFHGVLTSDTMLAGANKAHLTLAELYSQLICTCSFPDLGLQKQVTQINVEYKIFRNIHISLFSSFLSTSSTMREYKENLTALRSWASSGLMFLINRIFEGPS